MSLAVQMAAERRMVEARKAQGWKQQFSFAKDLNARGQSKTANSPDGPLQLGKGLHLGPGLFLGTDPQGRTEE